MCGEEVVVSAWKTRVGFGRETRTAMVGGGADGRGSNVTQGANVHIHGDLKKLVSRGMEAIPVTSGGQFHLDGYGLGLKGKLLPTF